MKKAIYSFIIVLIALPIMAIGFTLENKSLLVNEANILQIVIPAFTFLLTNLFVLLFDKEKDLPIIIGTSLIIFILSDLITFSYFNFELEAFGDGQRLLWLVGLAGFITLINILSLGLYHFVDEHTPKFSPKKSKQL